MDFYELLGLAVDKQKDKPSTEGRFLSTKIAPAQKDPKQKKLSENVKKFMDLKNAEQQAKEKEDEEKRKNLLQLRAENKKSTRTMKAMLSMTKSADKSALAEAKRTTAVGGLKQCDEDDYGYESNAARSFFEKFLNKFEANPEDPMDKFTKSGNKKKVSTNLQETKSRMRDKLAEDEDEPDIKYTRKPDDKKSSASGSMSSSSSTSASKKEEDPKKKKVVQKSHPPPPSFADLLKMAETAKAKPVETKSLSNSKEFEFDRPMTSKEKEEYFREKASQARKSGKAQAQNGVTSPPGSSKPSSASSKPGPASSKSAKPSSTATSSSQSPPTAKQKDNPASSGKIDPGARDKGPSSSSKKSSDPAKKSSAPSEPPKKAPAPTEPPKKPVPKITGPEFHPAVVKKPPPKEVDRPKNGKFSDPKRSSDSRPSQKPVAKPSSSKRPRSRSRSRSPPYRRERLPSRSPSPEFRRKPSSSKHSKRQRIDSESEYDSEMDDFIDDSEANIDISAEIRSIFGYDRRKFRDEGDFDDRSMENNRFADVMREEARSAKIGRMEDLEDMRREEEEKRRKTMKKKQKR